MGNFLEFEYIKRNKFLSISALKIKIAPPHQLETETTYSNLDAYMCPKYPSNCNFESSNLNKYCYVTQESQISFGSPNIYWLSQIFCWGLLRCAEDVDTFLLDPKCRTLTCRELNGMPVFPSTRGPPPCNGGSSVTAGG